LYIAIINIFVPELGRLRKYESSIGNLCDIRLRYSSDLFVWNPADTTRKS